jgi:putative ATPase
MLEHGEDPRFLCRRMMIFASEDIGNADPRALQLAVATADAFERLGNPEGRIPIAHCITYLASAPKSNRSYRALREVEATLRELPKVTVPLHLRNAPTKLMKELGYGANYEYPHDSTEGFVAGVQYLPDEIAGKRFYEPSTHGLEKAIGEKLMQLRGSK